MSLHITLYYTYLQHERDLGILLSPGEGAVPALCFFTPEGAASPSHMFSGSADGSVSIWRAGKAWDHLKVRGAVIIRALCLLRV